MRENIQNKFNTHKAQHFFGFFETGKYSAIFSLIILWKLQRKEILTWAEIFQRSLTSMGTQIIIEL